MKSIEKSLLSGSVISQLLDINTLTEHSNNINIELDYEEYEAVLHYEACQHYNTNKVSKFLSHITILDYINNGITESNNLIINNIKKKCKIKNNIIYGIS